MLIEDAEKFRTFDELQSTIEKNIDLLKKKSEEYSKIIGDKLRESEKTVQDDDIVELKEKLNEPTDPKKKKTVKKDKKTNWHDLGGIIIYDGIGTKGELELFFKTLENIKSQIENLEKAKVAISDLISKGLKKDIGCVAIMRHNSPFEIVIVKSGANQRNFSFKSIFSVNTEPMRDTKHMSSGLITI